MITARRTCEGVWSFESRRDFEKIRQRRVKDLALPRISSSSRGQPRVQVWPTTRPPCAVAGSGQPSPARPDLAENFNVGLDTINVSVPPLLALQPVSWVRTYWPHQRRQPSSSCIRLSLNRPKVRTSKRSKDSILREFSSTRRIIQAVTIVSARLAAKTAYSLIPRPVESQSPLYP